MLFKKYRLWCLGLVLSLRLPAQSLNTENIEFEWVVRPQYEAMSDFSEGLAATNKDEQWGFIDRKGRVVIPFQYSAAWDFKNGLAIIKHQNQWGIIDKKGVVIVEPEFDELDPHNCGWNCYYAQKNEKWGVLNQAGETVHLPQFDYIEHFRDGLAAVRLGDKHGFIDTLGNIVIPIQYEAAVSLHKNLLGVKKSNQWSIIDKLGNSVVASQFEAIGSFSENLMNVQKNGKWGFINPQGQVVIPFQWEDANRFKGRLAGVQKNKKWGFINPNGSLAIPCQFEEIGDFEEGYAKVKQLGRYGFINSTGTIVFPIEFEAIGYGYEGDGETCSYFNEGFAEVQKNGKWGFADKTGKLLGTPQLDQVHPFKDGLAIVRKGTLSGMMNRKGQLVIPIQFNLIFTPFEGGVILVEQNEKRGLLYKTGKPIITPQFEQGGSYHQGFATFQQNGKWGILKIKEPRPVITWNEPKNAQTKTLSTNPSIKVRIQSKTQPSIRLYIDGKITMTRGTILTTYEPNDGSYSFELSLPLPIRTAPYKIELEAQNTAGTSRRERSIEVSSEIVPVAEKRLALLIGNSHYQNMRPLGEPPLNDANDMAVALQSVGFKVIRVENANKQQLETQIRAFASELTGYDVGLFFYAGHGLGFQGKNYLLPIDFPEQTTKADILYHCVETDWIQKIMADAGKFNKTNIVIIDACRNAGHLNELRGDDSNTWVQPTRVPTGFITCFAASQGQMAENSNGRNGLYTGILLQHLLTPQLKIEDLFKRVRVELLQKGAQEPEEVTKLTKDFYFNRQ